MGTLELPNCFHSSYEDFKSYPNNLVYQTSYSGALQEYVTRLDNAEGVLFIEDGGKIFIPFRDLGPAGQAPQKQNIMSDTALNEWLGYNSTTDPSTSTHVASIAVKEDPKCRFIFISAGPNGDSRKPLAISRNMLARILTYHQVMPSYLDFISVFGLQSEARDLRYSSFREQTLLSDPPRGPAVPKLGRSGRQFQLCYNLKSVTCLSAPHTVPLEEEEWSIRQAAFHHQFDVITGTTLWIVTKGDLVIKARAQEMTSERGRPEDKAFDTPEKCLKSSLAAHLLYCHWATEDWRWYIQWLEEVIQSATSPAIYGDRKRGAARHKYTPDHLQVVQDYEERTNIAIMILEANVDVMTSLRNFYERLMRNNDYPLRGTCEDIVTFTVRLDEMIYDFKMHIRRANLLTRITADRKNLVSQHLQSQATEKMEDLTLSMGQIGADSQKEAIAMRIITVVTLIFLPATFVSTFFSTDIVKFQNPNGGVSSTGNGGASSPYNSFSQVALNRWLEVTVPLTFITLVASWIAFEWTSKRWRGKRNFFNDLESKIISS